MPRLIHTSLSLVTPPSAAPLSTQWALDHIKAIHDDEDHLVESWILAAAQYFEEITGRQIMAATWDYWLDGSPVNTRIELPRPPLREVLSVEYLDADGSPLAFSDGASPETAYWHVHAPQGPHAPRGWIEPISGQRWPTVSYMGPGALRIRYIAGYATTESGVPDLVRAALALLIAQFDQFRSETHLTDRGSSLDQLPLGAAQLMRGFQYSALPTQVLQHATGWPWR